MDPEHTPELRISDAERHEVAEVLRHAAGEGRLELHELEERLEATFAARTYADLVPLTADLPVRGVGPTHDVHARPVPGPAPGSMVPAAVHERSVAVMGDCTRRGVWRVPEQHTAFALMGGVTLDLREAQLAAREVVIDAYALMAGIDIVVNAHTQVIVEGVGVMGDFSQSRDRVAAEIGPDSPVVRVRGLAVMAGVSIKRKPMPGESRKLLRRR